VAASPGLEELLGGGSGPACCAALYESAAVRWLLGDELHPGGEATTRRSLELIEVRPRERLLDVGSGPGTSALLAAREFGCVVAGVDYGVGAVRGAQQTADATGLCDQVGFVVGDAGALPFADGEFDAVLCECSLSVFSDKARALAEMRRVLRRGGRVAISDVIAEPERLPPVLTGSIAQLACVGGALPRKGFEALLAEAGLDLLAVEPLDAEAARMVDRLDDRLRAARMVARAGGADSSSIPLDEAIEVARLARRAISDGTLGYAIFAATG
jgi:arsenite methyltransferase